MLTSNERERQSLAFGGQASQQAKRRLCLQYSGDRPVETGRPARRYLQQASFHRSAAKCAAAVTPEPARGSQRKTTTGFTGQARLNKQRAVGPAPQRNSWLQRTSGELSSCGIDRTRRHARRHRGQMACNPRLRRGTRQPPRASAAGYASARPSARTAHWPRPARSVARQAHRGHRALHPIR